MEDMNSKKTVNNILRYSTCSLGSWTNRYKCIPEGCSVPTVSNARVQQKAASKYKHMEEITVVCKKRFHFNQTVTTKVTKFETTCNLGNWTDNIPQECIPDGCQLVIHKGSNYYLANTNESITNAGLMEHGTEIQLQGTERFDLFDDKNNIFLDKNNMPTVICYQGEWKNKHFCKEVICDPKCLHGGKCVGPGKCVCPEGRFGSNCEQAGCILPENAPKVKSKKMFYQPRGNVTDFECEYNEVLSSTTGMTCLEDGSWSNSVQCLKVNVYLIRVKTDDSYTKLVGTDAKVYIYLHGPAGRTNRLNLRGNFDRNDLDETSVQALDVRPITYVRIGHDGSGWNAEWRIQFVSIFVENMNEYYVFRKKGPVWVYENEDVLVPRLDCILTFHKGRKEKPIWDKNPHTWIVENMSEQACLQGCTELSPFRCNAVEYNPLRKTCWGLAYSADNYFSSRRGNWKSHVYRPYCLYQ
ncbi:uncharacterized protein LOC123549100 [Mercenaria mercenaria]|uniref:uncharacterized protein LOC123549100 n=1 Tax=Mercenaria mercenaria TaxID=6596 RepID=UPI00234EC54E|nr:uncharacterized protein LOC123549100 [Mercenaria mercenaria]